MQTLAHYALLGSLLAGIAGAAILALVTLRYGFRRHVVLDGDEESVERSSRRLRTARIADTLAVLCFAVAASLAVIGLTQQSRAATLSAGGALAERLEQLETRVAESVVDRQAGAVADFKAWEERLARLESRLGAMEERAAVADRRLGAAEDRVAATDRRVQAAERLVRTRPDERARDTLMMSPNLSVPTPAAVAPAPAVPTMPPARSEPPASERPDASAKPDSAPAAPARASITSPAPPPSPAPAPSVTPPAKPGAKKIEPSSPATAQATPAARREPARAPGAPAAKPDEPSLGEKLRQDWEAIKRDTSRGGDEWREGWARLRRLFTP